MDKLTSMRVFVTIVREGSFTAAANKLGISTPMVSRHVRQLEDELGVRLLNRSTHGISVTDSGRAYRARCKQILADLDEAEGELRDIDRRPHGTLKIGAPPTLGTFHIAPVLSQLVERNEHMSVALELHDRPLDPIEDGLDVVIRIGRIADSAYIARTLGRTHYVACAAPSYIERHGAPQYLHDLARHNCLRHTTESDLGAWRFTVDGKEETVRVHGNFKTTLANALRHVAVNGVGIAYLPTFIVGNDIDAGRLVRVLESVEAPSVPIHAIYPHRRHLSAKVQVALDAIAERLKESLAGFDHLLRQAA